MKTTRLLSLLLGLILLLPANLTAAEKVYKIKFGTLAPDNTPWSKLLQEFDQKVSTRSGGRVKTKLFLNGVMGDERAMLQKMRFGQLTGGGFSTGGISTVVPELQLLELPFLFRNNDEVDYVLDKVVREDMQELLKKRGLYLLMWAENGWLDFGNQTRPVTKPEDLKDIKWFAQESDVMFAFWEALGVTQVPLAVPEVLSALQTGLVGGYHNTPVFASGAQWYSQTKYWTISHHIYQPAAVVVDLKFWNSAPDDLKKIVLDVSAELEPRVRSEVRGLDADLLKGFKENGISINELNPAQRAAFEKMTEKVGDKLVQKGVFSKELLTKVRTALAEYRKGKK